MAGNVKSAQAITAVFTTSSPTTGAAINADSLPSGTLYVNGTANGATVTVTNIDTGRYKAAFTLPSLSAGDVVDLSIAATVGTIAGKAVVWSAVADTKRVSDLNDAAAVSAASIRTEMDSNSTKLANLDTTVSSRLSTAGYTAPPTVVAIRSEIDTNSTKLDAAITTRATPAQILLTPANLLKTNASNQVEASSVQGSVTGSVASVTGAVGSVTGNVGGNVTGSVASVTGAVGSVTGNVGGSVGSVTAGVTVTTNNDKTGYTASTVSDKTGYSLSAGGVQAIWDALTSALTTVGSVGKRIADNLDATVTSRLATSGYTAPSTPPTVTQIRTEMDTNSTKLVNLDAAVSSRLASGPVTVGTNSDKTGYALRSAGVQAIWDALTSALTTVGSVGKRLGDFVDAAISSRNATAPDNTSIATILTRTDVATSTRASATDYTTARAAKLDNLDATISSRNATTPLNATQTENAVWNATMSSHTTTGTTGAKLNTGSGGAGSDPLLNLVPGSYASGTAGYYLGRLAGSTISVTAPVIAGGAVQVIRGDSYYSADARALIWTVTGLPTLDFTGAVTTFSAKMVNTLLTKNTADIVGGVTASFSGNTLTLTVELDTADTVRLGMGDYRYDIQTEFANGHVETWVQGTMTVIADVR